MHKLAKGIYVGLLLSVSSIAVTSFGLQTTMASAWALEIATFILFSLTNLHEWSTKSHDTISYEGLDDVFEIAAKYALAIAQAHALSDANIN